MVFGQHLILQGRGPFAKIVIMEILGIGTDIVECLRIGRMIEQHGEIFLRRVYTEREIRYCQERKHAIEHFAGRWAAKEAILKCLGSGWRRGLVASLILLAGFLGGAVIGVWLLPYLLSPVTPGTVTAGVVALLGVLVPAGVGHALAGRLDGVGGAQAVPEAAMRDLPQRGCRGARAGA